MGFTDRSLLGRPGDREEGERGQGWKRGVLRSLLLGPQWETVAVRSDWILAVIRRWCVPRERMGRKVGCEREASPGGLPELL